MAFKTGLRYFIKYKSAKGIASSLYPGQLYDTTAKIEFTIKIG